MTNNQPAPALSDAEERRLSALLDTILPASEGTKMPSAAEMDFVLYINMQAAHFMPGLTTILARFDDTFAARPLAERVALVQKIADRDAWAFRSLVFHIYDCYYQSDQVRDRIGAHRGTPFPDGRTIPAGDLSSLEAVKTRGKEYRR